MIQKIVFISVLAVLLHRFLGWEFTLLAGMIAGMWERGWLVGMAGVGAEWAGWHLHHWVRAPEGYRRLLETMGALAGGLPEMVVVLLSVLVGVLLGGLGAVLGTSIRRFLQSVRA